MYSSSSSTSVRTVRTHSNEDACFKYSYGYEDQFYTSACYSPWATDNLVYYAKVAPNNRERRRDNPNCFVRAFRWYTQEHVPQTESGGGPCNDDAVGFADWLDCKYGQYLAENPGAQCCQGPNDNCSKKKRPRQKQGEDGKMVMVKDTSLVYILEPKEVPRTMSECCRAPPNCCRSAENMSKKNTAQSQSTLSSQDKVKTGKKRRSVKKSKHTCECPPAIEDNPAVGGTRRASCTVAENNAENNVAANKKKSGTKSARIENDAGDCEKKTENSQSQQGCSVVTCPNTARPSTVSITRNVSCQCVSGGPLLELPVQPCCQYKPSAPCEPPAPCTPPVQSSPPVPCTPSAPPAPCSPPVQCSPPVPCSPPAQCTPPTPPVPCPPPTLCPTPAPSSPPAACAPPAPCSPPAACSPPAPCPLPAGCPPPAPCSPPANNMPPASCTTPEKACCQNKRSSQTPLRSSLSTSFPQICSKYNMGPRQCPLNALCPPCAPSVPCAPCAPPAPSAPPAPLSPPTPPAPCRCAKPQPPPSSCCCQGNGTGATGAGTAGTTFCTFCGREVAADMAVQICDPVPALSSDANQGRRQSQCSGQAKMEGNQDRRHSQGSGQSKRSSSASTQPQCSCKLFVTDAAQTSDHAIILDDNRAVGGVLFMRLVYADKLKEDCFCHNNNPCKNNNRKA